jgi:ribosome-associated protein
MIFVRIGCTIPLSEIEFTYVRSSGPGGQNVNKVNSKAVLRWNAVGSPSLYEPLRTRMLTRLSSKLTVEGEIVLSSDVYRDQTRNYEDCLEKFKQMLIEATHLPKARKKTKPSYGSKKRAENSKKLHSQKKSLRKRSYD